MPTRTEQPDFLSMREAKYFAKHAERVLHRKKDIIKSTEKAEITDVIAQLKAAVKAKDQTKVNQLADQLDKRLSKYSVSTSSLGASWRENLEVLLVAFVFAVAVRAYFLQPFKIPTGSMYPTLNGLQGRMVERAADIPNPISRFVQSFWSGRTFVNVVSKVDDRVVAITPTKHWFFWTGTRIDCQSGHSYSVNVPLAISDQLQRDFNLAPGRTFRAGEPILRGYVDAGDQVFVDKFTYNFVRPKRGDVFVFRTEGIPGIHSSDPNVHNEFYIKRLAGLPGDTLRIAAPDLFINGQLAKGFGFERVMSEKNGYRGYSNMPFTRLDSPSAQMTAPPKGYIALGDNSYNSYDSRGWGPVPENNIVGRGWFVYWPFTSHWGFVK